MRRGRGFLVRGRGATSFRHLGVVQRVSRGGTGYVPPGLNFPWCPRGGRRIFRGNARGGVGRGLVHGDNRGGSRGGAHRGVRGEVRGGALRDVRGGSHGLVPRSAPVAVDRGDDYYDEMARELRREILGEEEAGQFGSRLSSPEMMNFVSEGGPVYSSSGMSDGRGRDLLDHAASSGLCRQTVRDGIGCDSEPKTKQRVGEAPVARGGLPGPGVLL